MENKNVNENSQPKSRTSRNSELYKSVYDISSYSTENVDVDTKEIDLDSLNNKTRKQYQQVKPYEEVIKPKTEEKAKEDEPMEEKVYDINSIIEKAKENKLIDDDNYNKFKNTQYNILSKLNIEENELEKVELNQEATEEEKEELKDLINTVTHKDLKKDLDMLEDLLPDNENTIVTESIVEKVTTVTTEPKASISIDEQDVADITEGINDEELKKMEKDKEISQLDNSFYTGTFKFTNSDIEGLENINSTVKTNNIIIKILLFLLGVIVTTIILFIVNNYI